MKEKVTFRKFNLYNSITQKVDTSLIDSKEYDLEISINGKIEYYQVRYFNSEFFAEKLTNLPEKIHISEYFKPCMIPEIQNFFYTDYYRREYEHRKKVEDYKKLQKKVQMEDYFCYLSRITQKKKINSQKISSGYIPLLKDIKNSVLLGYHFHIEQAANRYYVIFLDPILKKGYMDHRNSLYMIYFRNEFSKITKQLEDPILDLSFHYDLPIDLLSSLYYSYYQKEESLELVLKHLEKLKNTISFRTEDSIEEETKRKLSQILEKEDWQTISFYTNHDVNFLKEMYQYLSKPKEKILQKQ